MFTFRDFLKYWLPVAVWMGVIFSASTDMMSTQRTSRIIGPVLRWLIPDIREESVRSVQFAVRKAAHMGEYAVLALLVWRARRKPRAADDRPWSRAEAAVAWAVAAAYAVSDELHQATVPSRQGSGWDVLWDAAGAAAGLGLLWWLSTRRRR